jgi:hypothetical protein
MDAAFRTLADPSRRLLLDGLQTAPERLWHALSDPAFTQRSWATALHCDWQSGSTMAWRTRGITSADPEQVVLESAPHPELQQRTPARLGLTR